METGVLYHTSAPFLLNPKNWVFFYPFWVQIDTGVETDPYFPVLSWLTAFVQRVAGRKPEFSQIFQRTTRQESPLPTNSSPGGSFHRSQFIIPPAQLQVWKASPAGQTGDFPGQVAPGTYNK